MATQVNIAVDVMGGDNAPYVVLDGCRLALEQDSELTLTLCGEDELVNSFAAQNDRCIAHPTTEVIAMDEHPASAVKQKKDSSIVVGCQLVKEGKADGFFSAGSTGACLAAATLIIGRIKGVKRPALGVVIPAYENPTLLLDVGANADCKALYIEQFAKMGVGYMQALMNVGSPRVGLLNIGEEDTKGSRLALESYDLMSRSVDGFKGNCEGKDLLDGKFDVVVTDGFTGNVCLKTIEGTSKLLFKYLKEALTSDFKSKIGSALVYSNLKRLKEKINPDRYGGSPLLGIQGACIIGHGSSNAEAVKNGIFASCEYVRSGVTDIISSYMHNGKIVSKDGED